MIKRVGFACKFMHSDQTLKKKLLEEISILVASLTNQKDLLWQN